MTVERSLLHTVNAVIVLDNEGRHLFSRHFSPMEKEQQKQWEQRIWENTRRKPLGQVAVLDGQIIVYKPNLDVILYVVGPLDSNELLLGALLDGLFEALEALLKPQVDKKAMLDEFETVCLIMDQAVDGGIILEAESPALISKIAAKKPDGPLPEPSLAGAFAFAKEALAKRILK